MRLAAAFLVAAALPLLGPAPPAIGAEVSHEDFADLVSRAPSDPGALETLRDVDSVAGTPVDLDPILEGATPQQIERRLGALRVGRTPDRDPAALRAEAESILAERRYARSSTPKPLKGMVERVGGWLEGLGRRLERFADALPGGLLMFWTLAALLVMLGAAVLSVRLSRRASRRPKSPPLQASVRVGDPRDLEDEAEAAEGSGDLEASLRLRFRAGLSRLSLRGVLPPTTSLTSEEISSILRSATFDRLAATFDRVVYGRHPVSRDDVQEARAGWKALIREKNA